MYPCCCADRAPTARVGYRDRHTHPCRGPKTLFLILFSWEQLKDLCELLLSSSPCSALKLLPPVSLSAFSPDFKKESPLLSPFVICYPLFCADDNLACTFTAVRTVLWRLRQTLASAGLDTGQQPPSFFVSFLLPQSHSLFPSMPLPLFSRIL